MSTTAFHDLPSGIQFPYLERARFLKENGYIYDTSVEELAEKIYYRDLAKNKNPVGDFVAGMIK